MYGILVIVGLVASVLAKDLTVGSDGGSLKYDQNITASPTIWRHDRNVSYNVSDTEEITKVDIIDHREDKNGEAAIVEGGVGHKNVTIQLKSPAVFRGFDFEVRIYGKQEDETQSPNNNDQQNVQNPLLQDTNVNDKQTPKEVTDDVVKTQSRNNDNQQNTNGPFAQDTYVNDKQAPKDVTAPATLVPNGQDKVQHPIEVGQGKTEEVQRPNRDTQVQESEQKTLNPTVDKDLQSAKDNEKTNDAQAKQNKGFNPMTNEDDWKDVVDKIFTAGAEPDKESTKPTGVKSTKNDNDSQQIDIPIDGLDVHAVEEAKNTPTSTAKSIEVQQTEKSPQTKKQVHVPLPYVNH